jgi:hypothetical protein
MTMTITMLSAPYTAYTLPEPHEYSIVLDYPGGQQLMANNTIAEDQTVTGPKRTWSMAFRNLTSAQCTTLRTAFGLVAGASATFVDLESGSYTVTRDISQRTLEFTPVRQAAGLRWSTTLALREV